MSLFTNKYTWLEVIQKNVTDAEVIVQSFERRRFPSINNINDQQLHVVYLHVCVLGMKAEKRKREQEAKGEPGGSKRGKAKAKAKAAASAVAETPSETPADSEVKQENEEEEWPEYDSHWNA